MLAHPTPATLARRPPSTLDEPLYFPAHAEQVFGWLHTAAGGESSDLGLVICKPFGYEALCAHRGIRAFALATAAGGVATLTFDYVGTGDSADIDPCAEQTELWCRDILNAVAELKRRTGVRRVCLLGFRLGALLAGLVSTRTTIDALVAIAPVISGSSYLRELRTIQLMAHRRAGVLRVAKGRKGDGADGMEVSGYVISAETQSRLARIDLASLGALPVSSMLIIDRSGQPAAAAWSSELAERGMRVEYTALPGFVDMMMTVPHYACVPQEMIDHVRIWMLNIASRPLPATGRPAHRPSTPAALELALPGHGRSSGTALVERPMFFGPDSLLFGIVTEPRLGTRSGRAIVLLNAGAAHHVNVGRMYVALARHWALRGDVVMRMDLAGLGDSRTRPGRPDNEVYPPAAIDDVRAAIEHVRKHHGISAVTLGGVCSGGYHSLRAAAAHVHTDHLLIVNPDTFFPRRRMGYNDMQVRKKDGLSESRYWKRKLIEAVESVQAHGQSFFGPLAARTMRVTRFVARAVGVRLPNDLGWEVEQLVARGVRITVVFALGEPGLELLRLQVGAGMERLGDHFSVHLIDNADHTFSHSTARAVLERVLSDALPPCKDTRDSGDEQITTAHLGALRSELDR